MKALIFLCVVTGAALVYLMSVASSNNELFAKNYQLLLYLGVGFAVGLASLVGYQLWLLRRKLRDRVFGSKLTLRLMMVFALMALIPGGLMYAISFQFLQRSIESWFDVRIDESLERGLKLARNAIENSLHDLEKKAEAMATSLANSQAIDGASLERLRAHPTDLTRKACESPPAPPPPGSATDRPRAWPRRSALRRIP